ncbi:MAG: cobalamin biosynthesis protein CbiD [Firmicutes bacterium]|nr:cobalamin biosynthesis protein CbiD [Bacillota bacterium]
MFGGSVACQRQKVDADSRFTVKGGRKLRFGYTTGTCAAAAAKGSAELLLAGVLPESVRITTPAGRALLLEPVSSEAGDGWASCGIVKDAGDDPDITDGVTVFAKVEKSGDRKGDALEGGRWEQESQDDHTICKITILGGEGVGRVTRKGLEQPVGEAAINSVPRTMIEKAVRETAMEYGFSGALDVTISVPGGREIAEKTFNPQLGIEGGISILGTTGVVEPMSEAALIDTIDLEIRQKIAEGRKNLIVTPGNYGQDYLAGMEEGEGLTSCSIKSSNYIGETIDRAIYHGAEGILFVAHIGKFIKVAGGIMNTHSRNADGRAEIMASSAVRAGADMETVSKVLDTVTTDEAIEILEAAGLRDQTMKVIAERIHFYLQKRSMGKIKTEALIFSNAHGYLGETAGFGAYMDEIRKGEI